MDMDVELRAELARLPDIDPDPERFTWDFRRVKLRNHMAEEGTLRNFLRWSTVQEALFTGATYYVQKIYNELPDRFLEVIRDESGVGNPYVWRGTTGTNILQAYYIYLWEKETDKRIEDLTHIVEFGAGYGAMALIAKRLGYKGPYFMVDVPEVQILQRYYLRMHEESATYVESYTGDTDLLVACCSLSEVDVETRTGFIDGLDFDHNLIVYQDAWNLPNLKYAPLTLARRLAYSNNFRNPYYPNHWIAVR